MERNLIPSWLSEHKLLFKPTFKFDRGVDAYDTSAKQRIPSWTDRILFLNKGMRCISYNAAADIRVSDHRPVFATFEVDVALGDVNKSYLVDFMSESQVCSLM